MMRAALMLVLLASCAPTVIPEPKVYTGKDFAWLHAVSYDEPDVTVRIEVIHK